MQRGYVKIRRKLEDSGLLQMHGTLALFMFILIKATHKKTKIGSPIGVIELEPGQYISGRHKLSAAVGLSEREIRTCLSRLEELDILSIKTTSRFSIYTIVNYSIYQDCDQPSDQQTTSRRPADDQQTTTKQTHKHINTNTNTNTLSELSEEFNQFWNAWPTSKRKGGKADCVKFWKAHRLNEKSDEIIAHVSYCKSNGVWKDEQFIEAPIVYLRAFKWDGAEIQAGSTNKPFDMQEFMRSHT